jgi:uncharacterized YccA/Bax inhibitor family protein
MRTANPALNDKTFAGFRAATAESMTVNGTVGKTALLLGLALLGAGWVWKMFFTAGNAAQVMPWMIGGLVGGLVFAMVTIFKREWAGVTAPAYALLEGLFLGGISAFFEARFPGIVIQAVGLTFGTLLALLAAYRSGIIRATENFKLGVVAATGGIFVVYLVSMVMGFFGIRMPFIHDSGIIGIGFSLFVVVVAALNLVLDFDFIEHGAERGAPKYMEWYAAFGLIVTLVWLYLEILRLLSKLQSRR